MESGLTTEPPFETVYYESFVRFHLVLSIRDGGVATDTLAAKNSEGNDLLNEDCAGHDTGSVSYVSGAIDDPTIRIGQLDAADRTLVSVKPDASLAEATTLMMINNFSQLPVMQNERDVKGIIS